MNTNTAEQTKHTPGVREDHRTGQFFPTLDGKDISPTSFDQERALAIATQAATAKLHVSTAEHLRLLAQRDALAAELKLLMEERYRCFIPNDGRLVGWDRRAEAALDALQQ